MKRLFSIAVAAIALYASSAVAQSTIDVDLAGWETYGEYGNANNSEELVNIGAGSTVTGFEWINLVFNTDNGSWQSELVLSVEDFDFAGFIEWRPSSVSGTGTYNGSGAWGTGGGGGGPWGAGDPFITERGGVFASIYESFDDVDGDTRDAWIVGGTLRIHYAPAAIPEPSALALLAMASVGLVARRRRG